MDTIDERILAELSKNARATASEISRKVNLSVPAVSERIRKLDEQGVVEQYTVRISRESAGYKLLAVIFVNLESSANITGFRSAVVQHAEVIECYHMAGEYDYMLKALLRDTAELETYLSTKLKAIPGIQKTNTLIALSALKETVNRCSL